MCGGGGGGTLTTIGTIGGGVAGAFAGGPAGAAIGASLGGSLGASLDNAADGKRSAQAQQQIAEAQLAEQRETRRLASLAAEPTPQELAAIERTIELNNQDIQRKERLIASSDPALIEAGRQALELLQGKESAALSPIKRQREKDRLKLEETLRQRLGSGYGETTAGIQALGAFDEATTNALAGAQQASLNQLLGTSERTSAGYGLQSNIANQGTLSNVLGNISTRRASAIAGTPITAAGSQFVGDLVRAQQGQATTGSLLNLGGTLGSAYLLGGGSGPKTTTTQPTNFGGPTDFSELNDFSSGNSTGYQNIGWNKV